MDLKELLQKTFEAGNSYASMPEDDWNIIKKDFKEWYEEEGQELISSLSCKNTELDNTDKKLHISDFITRFKFPEGTEDKICRFLYLKGLIRTKTYDFYKFSEIFKEMCKLREEIGRL